MPNDRKRKFPAYPGARVKHAADTRLGSVAYMTRLLVDARLFGERCGVDVEACWQQAGGVVAVQVEFVPRELKQALVALLNVEELGGELPLDAATNQAIRRAEEVIALTEA